LLSCVPHALPISSSLIWSPRWHLMRNTRNTNHEAPSYADVFHTCVICSLWDPKYLPQHSILGTPSSHILLSICGTKCHTHTKQQAKL
jgi:hypothetical protein